MSRASKQDTAPAGAAALVPTEDPASYDEHRLWRDTPWGDTYWCEQCSTCKRWRHSQRARGRVCVTSFNFNFPLVIIEDGRCNEYRPVPGAEGLWAEPYPEEDEERDERRREGGGEGGFDEGGGGRSGSRRRPRRRQRRGGGGGGGGGSAAPPAP